MIEIKSVAQMHTYSDNQYMGIAFDWSTEKNHQLVEQRGVSFESVVSAIEQGGLLDVLEHPNQDRYPGQNIYVVEILGYVHLVPFAHRQTAFVSSRRLSQVGRQPETILGRGDRE